MRKYPGCKSGIPFHNRMPLCDFLEFAGFLKSTGILLNH